MCGICGYIGIKEEGLLEKMTETLTHRGPDNVGYFQNGNVGLGHRRLSIIDVARNFCGQDVVELLRYLFAVIGCPAYIRSDNGPESISSVVKKWLRKSGVETLYIAPGSPWENGYIESFNRKLGDELLNRELFLSIDELRYVADRWRMDYNHCRPHSSLDYMAPGAFAAMCLEQGSGSLRLTQGKENCCEVLS